MERDRPSSVNYLVRRCTLEDVDRVVEIEKGSYGWPWKREIMVGYAQSSNEFWVLEEDQTVVGYIISAVNWTDLHVVNLCVDQKYRGFGYARKLMVFSLYRGVQRGVVRSILEVRPSNTHAITLYKSLGYHLLGRYKEYYPTKDGKEDAHVFSRQIMYSQLALIPPL